MRLAIYFTPLADHPLTERASGWLGRDAFTNAMRPSPPVSFNGASLQEIAAEPRRYGFHATLKAPFRINDRFTADNVDAALDEFCARQMVVPLGRLRVARIDGFFALVPEEQSAEVERLADDAVTWFDGFRADPTAEEIARRRPEALSEGQRLHLERWGYPYVFDDFRFHMTLTGRIADDLAPAVEVQLQHWFKPVLQAPVWIEDLSIFAEEEPGADFVVRRSRKLRYWEDRKHG